MNIIAGKARGRNLKTLPGEATRPTQGKVRSALMSTLMHWVPDATWVDLYAGSGAIGLEAASRGARKVVLVENAAPAIAVIRDNMATLKLDGVELLGIDKYTTGAYLGLALTTVKFAVNNRMSLTFDPSHFALPAPRPFGLPFYYKQYRVTVGLEIAF